jgi:L-alanine-DL-glutamate epimerase-like enolase superfamily enzyme
VKITKIETVWYDEQPNTCWVQIHTDEGLVGLGETYYIPRAVAAVIHDVFANLLLGEDAFNIEKLWSNMMATVNFFGFAGSEMRAISAVDVALWDLLGQYLGQPIYNVLGGRFRDRIMTYNTCAGYGKYADFAAWNEGNAGELAQDLLKMGIRAMKVWPWDRYGSPLSVTLSRRAGGSAVGPVGQFLSVDDLQGGLQVVKDIRAAVGDRMEIAIEGHARWNLPVATKIAKALEPYDVMWLEEIIPPDNIDSYARLKAATSVPLCVSERLFTRYGFRQVVEKNAADVIMPDMAWCGGITETRKIAALADTYYLPITTHDCIGPVALWSAAHLALHAPNTMIVESVRAFYLGWYNDAVTDQIPIEDGYLTLNEKPGLGTKLRPEVLQRKDAHVEVSDFEHRKDMSKG